MFQRGFEGRLSLTRCHGKQRLSALSYWQGEQGCGGAGLLLKVLKVRRREASCYKMQERVTVGPIQRYFQPAIVGQRLAGRRQFAPSLKQALTALEDGVSPLFDYLEVRLGLLQANLVR